MQTDRVGPPPSRRGRVFFLLDLTLTLGMELPPHMHHFCQNYRLWTAELALSTVTVLHTALLLTTKVTSQQKKCSNGPRPQNSPVPPGVAPRLPSLRIDTSQFLVINLYLYKSPIGSVSSHQCLAGEPWLIPVLYGKQGRGPAIRTSRFSSRPCHVTFHFCKSGEG